MIQNKKGKVLIVDDSITARVIIQKCLEMVAGEDLEFAFATDGISALEKLRAEDFGVIITDMIMPNMNGKELLKKIKESAELAHVRVFVITSLGNPALEKELHELGVEEVIYKPVSPPKLMACVDAVMNEVVKDE